MYDWQSLEDRNKAIHEKVINNWQALINANHKESVYQDFLSQHAGFFFSHYDSYITISKLKLGSEFEADFVNVHDKWSDGIQYEFIEIEKPGSSLFTKAGVPSKDFNNALQQIRDWKRFLIDDKSFFRKFLPGNNTRVIKDSLLRFTIIIGRRTENEFINDKRSQIASEANIKIRSFDYLTDILKRRKFFNLPFLDSYLGDDVENLLESPFTIAMTDSKWKNFCRNGIITKNHFYKDNIAEIINLTENNALFKDFDSILKL